MNTDYLKLTTYFGEHRRVGHELLSDALMDVYQEHELEACVLLRGTEGFGLRHTLHTQRLLTLSEDLPLVSIAVDARARVEHALSAVTEIVGDGLVTVEGARMLDGANLSTESPGQPNEATKLTIYLGRGERSGSVPTYSAVVELLRRRGVSGATAFLGVDGMRHGVRHRARFFSRNRDVPLMVVSVGENSTIAAALPELEALLVRPLLMVERVRLLKREGIRLAALPAVPDGDPTEPGVWQKLTIYASEQDRHGRHPLYGALVRRLRAEGAAGATAVRGIWGYAGDHRPRGETALSLRRTAPVMTVLIDRPERMRRWWKVVDELTDEAGLVTSELVPAFQARADGRAVGALTTASGGA